MLKLASAIAIITLVVSPAAHADLLQAKRASVMCKSGAALAKLALPAGGSKNIGDHAPPAIGEIARDGGCNDFPQGNVVIVEKTRAHTSIVLSDSLTGDGVMTEVVVANIDYAPYVPPHDAFYDTIRVHCPTLLDGIAAEDPPTRAFISSLPSPLQASIGKVVDDECSDRIPCMIDTRIAEIGRRHLEDRWAAFLCAHPKDAVEPLDRSSVSAHD